MSQEIEKDQKNEIVSAETSPSLRIIEKLIKSSSTTKCGCKTCNSKNRAEIEQFYQRSQNLYKTYMFATSQKKQTITYASLSNHLKKHYGSQARADLLTEYATQIAPIVEQKLQRRKAIQERIAIMGSQMMKLMAESSVMSIQDRRYNLDLYAKLNVQVSALQSKIQEMDKSMQPFYILLQVLKEVTSLRMKAAQSNELKRELAGLIEDVIKREQIQTILLDRKVKNVFNK